MKSLVGSGVAMVKRRLPPHGGSGLKYRAVAAQRALDLSPSPRREWIEINPIYLNGIKARVSLPTEGVD